MMKQFQTIGIQWTPGPGRPYRLIWEDGDLVREWRGERRGQALTFQTWDAARHMIDRLPGRVIFSHPKD